MKKKLVSSLFLAILLVSLACSVLDGTFNAALGDNSSGNASGESNSWPMFHNDATHSGYSTSTGPLTNQTLWSRQEDPFPVDSSPAVASGVVYVGSQDGNVYAFNASAGGTLWSNELGSAVESSPAVVGGVLYVGSSGGSVFALNAFNGAILWSYQTGGEVISSPTVVGGLVYIGSADGNVYALNITNGAKIWSSPISAPLGSGDLINAAYYGSSPAVANGAVYIGANDGTVYSLNATTGAKIWNYNTNMEVGNQLTTYSVESSPTDVNGVVYVGSDNGNVYALNATNGGKLWSYTADSGFTSCPAIANGVVYIGSDDHDVYALNATNGVSLWCSYTGGISSSPAVANGIVYVGSMDFNVYALNATNGCQLWSYTSNRPIDSSPAVVNGAVYIGSDGGTVYAFGSLGGSSPPSPVVSNIAISPSDATVSSGGVVNYAATVFYSNGDSTIAPPSATWSIDSGAGGFWSEEGFGESYTSANAGAWTVTISFGGVYASTELTVSKSTVKPTLSVVLSGTQDRNIIVDNGTLFSADIRVDNATDLSGWSSGLKWNPSLLQLVSINEGPFLKDVYPTLFLAPNNNPFNDEKGILPQINDIVLGYSDVSGSGVLATLVFRAIGIGNGTIGLANIEGDQELTGSPPTNPEMSYPLIPFAISNCSISVQSQYPNIDFYHTGTVNFNDILYFVSAYIQYNEDGILNPACDFCHNGVLNFNDIVLFAAAYQYYGSQTASSA